MLDENSKTILKFLNSIANKTKHYSFVDFDIIKTLNIDISDLKTCISYLLEQDLIESFHRTTKIKAYRSTIKGLNYFKNDINNKIFTIIIAIISSLISSLITAIITILLSN